MRLDLARLAGTLFATSGLLLIAGCGGSSSVGPNFDVDTEDLPPSSIAIEREALDTLAPNKCGVVIVVRNLRTISVSVDLQWKAFDATGSAIADALGLFLSVPPGEAREGRFPFNPLSPLPCSAIAKFERTHLSVFRISVK